MARQNKRQNKYAAMFTLRSDGRYQASYKDPNGKRKYLYDRNPEALYHKLLEATTAPEEKIPTFREIAEAWERQHRQEIETRTWNNYRPHYNEIISRHGSKLIEEITAQTISNHLTAAKARGYSATVVNSIRSVYRMIFDHAIALDYAKYNPVLSVRLPKGLKRGKRTAPNDDQTKIILDNIDKPFGLFPFFLLCTGLRKSEALALTWDDVHFDSNEIDVNKSIDYTVGAKPKIKPPKTEAGIRTVPIIDVLRPHLLEALEASASPYIFPQPPSQRGGPGGGMMTLRGYEGAWLRYCQAVGMVKDGKPMLTAHNIRHGTATLMFELGVDELTAQRILGHSRVEITREIYTDLRAKQLSSSVSKFSEGMSKLMSDSGK